MSILSNIFVNAYNCFKIKILKYNFQQTIECVVTFKINTK